MNKVIRIIGVPEHFNLPWHMAVENDGFSSRGIDLNWTDIPEGTGRMVEMLDTGEADLAIILTEGIVKAISDGLRAVIVQEYIASPLLWGVHVHVSSPYREVDQLRGKIAAVSRFGSGSHLMAHVHADSLGWASEDLKFKVVNTLNGAVEILGIGEADYFLWERFTTQPIVDQGIFRRIGECPTPWPCFVIAARVGFISKYPGVVTDILEIINSLTAEFRQIPSIDRTLANRYNQELDAIREWLSLTLWSQQQIAIQDLEKVIITLNKLNLLSNNIKADDLLWNRN